jgi:hypothetical protein
MGLFTELLLLPLAPVRGVVWVAAQVAAEADRMLAEQQDPRRLLAGLQAARERGELTDDELAAAEEEILRRVAASSTYVVSKPSG